MDNTGESLHFRSETDQDNIVWLSFDKMETGTNVFSQEVLEELDRLLQGIAAQQPRGLVIRTNRMPWPSCSVVRRSSAASPPVPSRPSQ
jgi:enoyl-CoA hydratase/carnithine racemase